ncbi:LysM peptidoglycan-binding domain-containing protein [Hymenobacter latericus]|uniref:LysM peptidoglycan-binding domain-containing protein n=1 Tax=Hymenobacter sp. YIM 151858-1 TaxID=2987688 RepID=UPI002227068A|nr:LysM peptidoglycan-binding domain-containing protein [Hymenobacter sp. YIM 151858-1]UYZ57806.1 LysM peptidoglycan-binding domain-containing protein [Hymenobacter sp. YIM 151858-1]
MKRTFRASALLLLAAAFARPVAGQTQVPPIAPPEAGTDFDSTQVQLELAPDSLVAEPVLSPEKLAWMQTPPAMRDLVGDRLSCIDSDMPLVFNNVVMSHVTFFTQRNRTYMQRVLERENLYFPLFEKYLAKYNLPQDLKYLAVVESALIPTAKSRVGATGLWQFMGPTAGDLRLRRDDWVDERMDPEKATEAACKHLRFLYGMLHDWELVLAAYNWGPGNVQRVMRRTGKRNYWDLHPHMPQETRNYVPSFTAILYAMKYAQQHNLHAPDLRYQYAQPMDTLQIGGRAFDVARLGQAAGLDSVALLRMNPELRKTYLPEGYRPYAVKFPASARPLLQQVDRATLFGYCLPQATLPQPIAALPPRLQGIEPFPSALAANSNNAPKNTKREVGAVAEAPRTRRKVHTVRKGQTLGELAEWYGVSTAQLRRWNHLPKGKALRPKQQIVVFVPAQETNTTATAVAVTRKPTAPAVAAAPRTPSEMGVKVTKRPVATSESSEPATAAVAEPASAPVAAAAPRTQPPRSARAVAAETTAAEPEAVVAQAQAHIEAATEYVVRKGDYLNKVARERGLTVTQLMEWNNLQSAAVAPGQKLRLTQPADSETTAPVTPAAKAATVAHLPAKATKQRQHLGAAQQRVHIVQPGDTLFNISRRYQGLTVEQLRKLNNLKSDEVKPGQKLIVAS